MSNFYCFMSGAECQEMYCRAWDANSASCSMCTMAARAVKAVESASLSLGLIAASLMDMSRHTEVAKYPVSPRPPEVKV